MAEIIALANQKGGVGKTTTAINLAAALAHLGQDTLLIDLDPQCNATSGLGFEKGSGEAGIYNVLIDGAPIAESIRSTEIELLDMSCSSLDMVSAELELSSIVSRENRLRDAIETIKDSYSFILIDCPPSLGLLTLNALSASDKVLIPIQGEYYALEGLAQLVEATNRVQAGLNPRLQLEGGILTMFDSRYSLAQQVRSELEKFFGTKLFKTPVPRSVRLAEAPGFGKSIFQYDPKSKGSESYLAIAGELLSRRGWTGMKLN
ncbi:MAG: AAA family ATPase [Candidatus Brocadiia bacterium]